MNLIEILLDIYPEVGFLEHSVVLFLTSGGNTILFSIVGDKWGPLVAQLVKNLPAMQKTPVQFLGWEDPLEASMTTHSSILAWKIPMDRGAWQAIVHGAAKGQTQLTN